MKEIIRNGRCIKFNRIVAYGCSLTEGSELADYLLLPEKTFDEINVLKKKFGADKFYEKFGSNNTMQEVRQVQGTLTWVRWLADKFSVPYVNKGICGNSVQGMIFDIEKDLASNFLTETDLIIVGLTCYDRWLYFDDTGNHISPVFGYNDRWPSDHVHKVILTNIGNEYFLLYNWFQSIKYLDLLSEKLNGRLLQQYMHYTINDYLRFIDAEISDDFLTIIKQVESFNSIIDHNACLGKLVQWGVNTHAYNHPPVESHKVLATELFNTLADDVAVR